MQRIAARALWLAALYATALAANPSAASATATDGEAEAVRQSPRDWLQRMSEAQVLLDFRGTLVYLRDGQLDALGIEHRAGPAGGRERLRSLSGESLEVVRDAGGVRFAGTTGLSLWPGAGAGAMPSLSARLAPADHYEVVLAGQDRIAQRPAQVIDIRARDGFRYGYRLWLDADSALLLKSLTLGPDGRTVEQVMFTELTSEPTSEAQAEEEEAPAAAAEHASTAPRMVAAWQVLDAPAGFAVTAIEAGAITHLLFSDGVAKVSVYVEPLSAQKPTLSGLLSRGALHVFGRVAHGRQIVAIGDVPGATIERFAQGVVPVADGTAGPP